MRLSFGGIFNNHFIAIILLNPLVKKVNQSTFGEVMGKSRVFCFLTHVHLKVTPMNFRHCVW